MRDLYCPCTNMLNLSFLPSATSFLGSNSGQMGWYSSPTLLLSPSHRLPHTKHWRLHTHTSCKHTRAEMQEPIVCKSTNTQAEYGWVHDQMMQLTPSAFLSALYRVLRDCTQIIRREVRKGGGLSAFFFLLRGGYVWLFWESRERYFYFLTPQSYILALPCRKKRMKSLQMNVLESTVSHKGVFAVCRGYVSISGIYFPHHTS